MKIRALLVGINLYDSAPRLYGCVNDATAVDALLRERFEGTDDSVHTLLDGGATRQAILDGLDWLADTSEVGVEVPRLLYYSGHGTFQADDDGDETDGVDECLVPSDHDTSGLIRDDVMRDWGRKLDPAQHALAIIDTCHSGTMMRMMMTQLPPEEASWLEQILSARANKLAKIVDQRARARMPSLDPAKRFQPGRAPARIPAPHTAIPEAPHAPIPAAPHAAIPPLPHAVIPPVPGLAIAGSPGLPPLSLLRRSRKQLVADLLADHAPKLAADIVDRARRAVRVSDPAELRRQVLVSLRETLLESIDRGVLIEAKSPPDRTLTPRYINPPAGSNAEWHAVGAAQINRIVARVDKRFRHGGTRHFAPVDEFKDIVSDEIQKQNTEGSYGLSLLRGNVVLIAACDAGQLATEDTFDDGSHGVLTHHLLKLIREDPAPTYESLVQRVSEAIDETYWQTPQLECSEENRRRPFLGALPPV